MINQNPGRDIRLDLLGPAAFGAGPGWSKESDSDGKGWRRWLLQTEPGRAGPGRAHRCTVTGKWRYSWPCPVLPTGYRTASRLPYAREALRACQGPHFLWESKRTSYGDSHNRSPSYTEHIRRTHGSIPVPMRAQGGAHASPGRERERERDRARPAVRPWRAAWARREHGGCSAPCTCKMRTSAAPMGPRVHESARSARSIRSHIRARYSGLGPVTQSWGRVAP
jgi:hypothetical protein